MFNDIIKCSNLFKKIASTYLENIQKSPAAWTKIFLQLGYSGIHDPGFGIIHPNEPAMGVIFGNKFLDILSIVNNPDNHKKITHQRLSLKQEYENLNSSFMSAARVIDLIDEIIRKKEYNTIIAGNLSKLHFNINELPKKLLRKMIKFNNEADLKYIITKTNDLENVIEISFMRDFYIYYFLMENKNFSKEEKTNLINSVSDKINSFDEEAALTLIKISKTKYKNENVELSNSLDILKQYSDKPYHYIHYTDTPQLIGINPKYSYKNIIGIYGYILNQATYSKILSGNSRFATDRSYIIIFKAKNPSTILDLGNYNETNLKQDAEKLKQLYPNFIDYIDQLYNASKKNATVSHPGSQLFYITALL